MQIHWIWLSGRTGMNERAKLALLEHFHDPEDIYGAREEELSACGCLSEEGLASALDKDLSAAEEILKNCEKRKVRVVTWGDAGYPPLLRSIADPPLVLYYRGVLPDFTKTVTVGVVGTRKASAYGRDAAERLSYEICRCGGMVATGMALGIDSAAALGALKAGGTVIGVLGSGPERVYPASNRALFARVEKSGCLISEYAPGSPVRAWNFPRRNRIISGISGGVLVAEAPEKSGALITARLALEQGREVFAVPGNLGNDCCAGSNLLLREGASVVTCGWDIVGGYAARYPGAVRRTEAPPEDTDLPRPRKLEKTPPGRDASPQAELQLTADERAMAALLDETAQLIDDVIAGAPLSPGAAMAALTTLEMKGGARTLPGRRVCRG